MKYISQFDASDCGAACLAMVAHYYGSRWSVARIRDVAGTDRRGTNLNGMVIAAEELGFSAKALKSEEKYLDNDLPLPFIAHIERYCTILSVKAWSEKRLEKASQSVLIRFEQETHGVS